MRNQLTSLAEKRVNELVVEYEKRLEFIEDQLRQKSDIIHQNQPRSNAPTKCTPFG